MQKRLLCLFVALIMLFAATSASAMSVDRESGAIRFECDGVFGIASIFPLKNGNMILSFYTPGGINGEPVYGENTRKVWLLCVTPDGSVLWEHTFGEEQGTSRLDLLCEGEDGSVLGFLGHSANQVMQYTQLQRYCIQDGSLLWAGEKTTLPEDDPESYYASFFPSYFPAGNGYLLKADTYQMYNVDDSLRWQVEAYELGGLAVLRNVFETPYGTVLLDNRTRAALVNDDGQVVWKRTYSELAYSSFTNGTVSPTGEVAMLGLMHKAAGGLISILAAINPEDGEMRWHTEFDGGNFRYGNFISTGDGWLVTGDDIAGTDSAVGFHEVDAQGNFLEAWSITFPNDILCMSDVFAWNDELWSEITIEQGDFEDKTTIVLLERIR
ncbi:MAG: DUF1218 domain-containing protein [Clostridia bacterium]|nr:DUF1218 domain-containing protein [Clostridia bacterium]